MRKIRSDHVIRNCKYALKIGATRMAAMQPRHSKFGVSLECSGSVRCPKDKEGETLEIVAMIAGLGGLSS
jgi:hypothetical protein